jgi:hypothetical protein
MLERILIGVVGAFVGVIGWLFVGIYIQNLNHSRAARDAGRAVYFELGANDLAVFMALQYGSFALLNRSTFDRLLPELATWLPAPELQALVLAYLGQGGYAQLAEEEALPEEARKAALEALLEAHRVALELLRKRVFTPKEIASLNKYAGDQETRLIEAAARPPES